MTIEKLNGFLKAFSLLNSTAEIQYNFCISVLPHAPKMRKSIDEYFSQFCTNDCPPKTASEWKVRLDVLDSDWQTELSNAARRWFLEQHSSPKLHQRFAETTIASVLFRFTNYVSSLTDGRVVAEVRTHPPIFYETNWQDFAFSSSEDFWLLHFGCTKSSASHQSFRSP